MENVNYFLREHNGFIISTDPDRLNPETVYGFLVEAKWWAVLTHASLRCALNNSLCFSLLEGQNQIGFARVITDYVTFAYLCDVYIVEDRRRRGLGSWMVRSILEHPDLKALKRIALVTHDRQSFYLRLDFRFTADLNCYMERMQ